MLWLQTHSKWTRWLCCATASCNQQITHISVCLTRFQRRCLSTRTAVRLRHSYSLTCSCLSLRKSVARFTVCTMSTLWEDCTIVALSQGPSASRSFRISPELDLSQFCRFYPSSKSRPWRALGNCKASYLYLRLMVWCSLTSTIKLLMMIMSY